MRVLLSPAAEETGGAADAAEALSGPGGEVATLSRAGVRNVRRRLSQAEIHAARKALLGLGPGEALRPPSPTDAGARGAGDGECVVGYVCVGRAVSPDGAGGAIRGGGPDSEGRGAPVVVVTDHANLTWRSPLLGPNDEALGPRFPVMVGLYRPAPVREALRPRAPSGAAPEGVVAGVRDEWALTTFERAVVERHGFPWISSELVNVAILAAHLGLKLAAGVIVV